MVITNDNALSKRIDDICKSEMQKPSFKEVTMLFAQLMIYRTIIYPRTTALAQALFRWLTRKGVVVGSSAAREFEPVMADDFFKRMSCVQAKSGLRQLRRINNNILHRRKTAKLYDELLLAKGWKPRLYDSAVQDPVMVRYPVRVTEKQKALEEAASVGVELGSWFECPLHPIETPMSLYNYEIGMCPEAEKASREVVNLPLHPRAGEETARRTVDFITKFTQVF